MSPSLPGQTPRDRRALPSPPPRRATPVFSRNARLPTLHRPREDYRRMSALFIPDGERDSMGMKTLQEEPAAYSEPQPGPPSYLSQDYGTPEEDTYL